MACEPVLPWNKGEFLEVLGRTDREVSELVGVRRETVTKWHKNPFFIAELNARREELWKDSKNRLKSLVDEAVNILSNGLYSSDQKVAMTAAGHILKTVGLYSEVKEGFGPTTSERAVWDQRAEKELQIYMALRPDSFCEWSVKNRMEGLAHEDVQKSMGLWYELAVDEQRAELRQYKKKLKAQQPPQVEPVPLVVVEDATEQDKPSTQDPLDAKTKIRKTRIPKNPGFSYKIDLDINMQRIISLSTK